MKKIILLLFALGLLAAACNQPNDSCKKIGQENSGQMRDVWQCDDGIQIQ